MVVRGLMLLVFMGSLITGSCKSTNSEVQSLDNLGKVGQMKANECRASTASSTAVAIANDKQSVELRGTDESMRVVIGASLSRVQDNYLKHLFAKSLGLSLSTPKTPRKIARKMMKQNC